MTNYLTVNTAFSLSMFCCFCSIEGCTYRFRVVLILECPKISLRKIFLPITTVFNPRTYRDIKKLIKQENIEVVHVHNTLNLVSPAVYYAARRMKVPVVQTIHNFRLLCPGATFYRDGHICEDCVEHPSFC